MIAGVSEARKKVSPGVRGVGESVQAEREWTRSTLQRGELEAFGAHYALHDVFGHAETVPE